MGKLLYRTGLVTQSMLYIGGGVAHFALTRAYTTIMPTHYTHPAAWVRFTGAAEIAGGLGLLLPQTRRAASWGIILMLIGYFDVHFYMLQNSARFAPIPRWALQARIPLQLVLIAWAYVYAQRTQPSERPVYSLPS